MNENNLCIAGNKTYSEWLEFSQALSNGKEAEWELAFSEYFEARLNSRYFDPITTLQYHDICKGEGFSMMAILCSLIEFLESTVQGKIYRYVRNARDLGEHEYCHSKSMFKSFLINREPFNMVFDHDRSEDFYSNIRCGLLHEAGIKGGWRIRANSESKSFIDFEKKEIYRNNFKDAIEKFIDQYKKDLLVDKDLQESFIRKFNSLV